MRLTLSSKSNIKLGVSFPPMYFLFLNHKCRRRRRRKSSLFLFPISVLTIIASLRQKAEKWIRERMHFDICTLTSQFQLYVGITLGSSQFDLRASASFSSNWRPSFGGLWSQLAAWQMSRIRMFSKAPAELDCIRVTVTNKGGLFCYSHYREDGDKNK